MSVGSFESSVADRCTCRSARKIARTSRSRRKIPTTRRSESRRLSQLPTRLSRYVASSQSRASRLTFLGQEYDVIDLQRELMASTNARTSHPNASTSHLTHRTTQSLKHKLQAFVVRPPRPFRSAANLASAAPPPRHQIPLGRHLG